MTSRLRELSGQVRELEDRVRQGGGPERAAKQHKQGKLTARERVAKLLDEGTRFLEIGLLVAYDQYEGEAPSAGVVTGLGIVHGREVVVVANDATVKAGSWWPETIRKILRAQEIAMRCRVPIIYLVDSAGVNLPYQGGVFPGQYGAARIFYYNSIMRRYLRVPQLAAVMGQCVAGGAYLPALSDVIVMVKGTSFMGLGGPNLVKGATGQAVDAESLGGAVMHTEVSAVAHYAVDDDDSVSREASRDLVERLGQRPQARGPENSCSESRVPSPESRPLRHRSPADHRMSYDMHTVLKAIVDDGRLDEFQEHLAREMICADASIDGMAVGVIANQRGLVKGRVGEKPRFGGIVYAESAEKVAFFIDRCDREGIPLLFVQDVSGFMVGPEAEQEGIIRSGARWVEAMATRASAEDRVDGEPRVRRRLLCHGRAGIRPGFRFHVAIRPDGGDGGGVGGAGGPWPGPRQGRAGEEGTLAGSARGHRGNARGLRAPARRAVRRSSRLRGRHHPP